MSSGWKLDHKQREKLLSRFPPAWPDVVADHVTFESGITLEPPPKLQHAEIVGRAENSDGVEALVISINGVVLRPDGSTYHITWSIDRSRGRNPVDSDNVLRHLGWTPIEEPIEIRLTPTMLE